MFSTAIWVAQLVGVLFCFKRQWQNLDEQMKKNYTLADKITNWRKTNEVNEEKKIKWNKIFLWKK